MKMMKLKKTNSFQEDKYQNDLLDQYNMNLKRGICKYFINKQALVRDEEKPKKSIQNINKMYICDENITSNCSFIEIINDQKFDFNKNNLNISENETNSSLDDLIIYKGNNLLIN